MKPSLTTINPSTADRTEIEGVIIASPKNNEVASTANIVSSQPRFPGVLRLISASSARLPPSPLLSAAMTISTYFSVTISKNAQNTRLSTPKTWSMSIGSGWWPTKVSFNA